jgi:cytoskeletal protein RodZ
MSEDIVQNNPKKELMFTLGGIALFLGIVLLIGVSAFLRPAGEHITAEPTEESAIADEAVAIAEEDTATATAEAAPAETDAAATTEADTAADATVTPAEDTSGAVVTAEAGTATATGTVNQAAVADVDLTAEQADGDLDAGDANKATTAQ